jgi:asparaginyl-tRNA synthetase
MTVVSVEHALAGKIPEGGEVTVRGWVRTVRGSGESGLRECERRLLLRPDPGRGRRQLANFDEIKRLTSGCSVIATGTW